MGGDVNLENFDTWLRNRRFGIGHDERDGGCGKPGCPIPKRTPDAMEVCSLNQPLHIYIPPGQHLHIDCPIHGSHIVYGPNITYGNTKWEYTGPPLKVRF